MKILITGGAGFIGSHLCDAYLAQGHEVVVIDNLSTGRRENIPFGARFYEKDIRARDLDDIFTAEKFNMVSHHAAQMDVRASVADPLHDAEVNVYGSINLLERCRIHGVKNFLFSSTGGAIYGEQIEFPASEEHPTNPVSPYGLAKLTVERYMNWYSRECGLNCSILRYANVYGPRQNSRGEAGVVAIFCVKMLNGQNPLINGDGLQTRDFVFIEDVVRANMLATEKMSGFQFYNIGTCVENDVNTIFHALNAFFGDRFKEIHGPAALGEQRRSVINPAKAERLLGWKPMFDLNQGLAVTAESFKSSR